MSGASFSQVVHPRLHSWAGAAPHALLRRPRRACGRGLGGHRADPQHSRQATACAAAGAEAREYTADDACRAGRVDGTPGIAWSTLWRRNGEAGWNDRRHELVTLLGRSGQFGPRRIGCNERRGRLSVQPNQPSISGRTKLGRLVPVGAHRKLLDEIVDSLMEGTQFVALTGTTGVGKSTMAAAIHEALNKHFVHVRRVDGCRGTGIHLRAIMSQFLDKPEADVGADDVERLFYVMTERKTPDERLALIIDDAERLLPDALAYLRLLVSVAPERMPQIVFIGAPSFWDTAGQLTEAGFKDLITARFVLEPLNATETFEATEQVISALCHTPRPVLDQGALNAIATKRDQTR